MRTVSKLLEVSPFEADGGNLIGKDPRNIPKEDWLGIQCQFQFGLRAIRAKCLDCAHSNAEVRKCSVTDCALWPLRLGSVPRGLRQAKTNKT